jgi:hypothetical protein
MVAIWLKYINKSPYKEKLLKIVEDILAGNLSNYDVSVVK